MHRIIILMGIVFLISSCNHISTEKTQDSGIETMTKYDSNLAIQYGADKYGMKRYVMAFLKRGPNRSQDSTTAAKLQSAHMENINRLANEGKLVLAGPFFDDGDIRGIYIFNVESVEEAKILTESDPAIKAGTLVMELHPWYGSAALMNVNDLHSKLSKERT